MPPCYPKGKGRSGKKKFTPNGKKFTPYRIRDFGRNRSGATQKVLSSG